MPQAELSHTDPLPRFASYAEEVVAPRVLAAPSSSAQVPARPLLLLLLFRLLHLSLHLPLVPFWCGQAPNDGRGSRRRGCGRAVLVGSQHCLGGMGVCAGRGAGGVSEPLGAGGYTLYWSIQYVSFFFFVMGWMGWFAYGIPFTYTRETGAVVWWKFYFITAIGLDWLAGSVG